MSTTSTLPTVKDTLVTALQGRAGLTGIQVANGHPGREMEMESIFTGQARGRHTIDAIRAGRKTRKETYTLDVIVYVMKEGGTLNEAEDRAFALLAEIENELADDPKLGSTVDSAMTGEWETTVGYIDTGAEAAIRLGIEITARLD